MQDVYDIVKNLERIYDSDTDFQVLKDFERVLDEVDMYVFKNWFDGELAAGPHIDRHWVTVRLFWPREKMPDPEGGKRLLDYDCTVKYQKTNLVKPRKIRSSQEKSENPETCVRAPRKENWISNQSGLLKSQCPKH
jgi:hypothetical protein